MMEVIVKGDVDQITSLIKQYKQVQMINVNSSTHVNCFSYTETIGGPPY